MCFYYVAREMCIETCVKLPGVYNGGWPTVIYLGFGILSVLPFFLCHVFSYASCLPFTGSDFFNKALTSSRVVGLNRFARLGSSPSRVESSRVDLKTTDSWKVILHRQLYNAQIRIQSGNYT